VNVISCDMYDHVTLSNSRLLPCSLNKHYEHNIKTALINQWNPIICSLIQGFPHSVLIIQCSISSKIVLILVLKSRAPKRSLEWGSKCMYITILEYKKYYHCYQLVPHRTYPDVQSKILMK